MYAEQHPEDSALNSFFSYLVKLRKMAAYTPIHSLLTEIYSGTGFFDRMTAMPGGEVRGENLLRLFDLAVAYEKNAMKGLFGFLRFVEKQKEYTLTSGGALEEGAVNAVRFMTIHKSKGLEFPVVFVFGCGKRFLAEKKENSIYLTKSGGLYMSAFDEERRLMSPLPTEAVARKREQGKSRGEALRVLYVALTRAKEKLIITGTIGKADDTDKALTGAKEKELPLSFAERLEAGSFLTYIFFRRRLRIRPFFPSRSREFRIWPRLVKRRKNLWKKDRGTSSCREGIPLFRERKKGAGAAVRTPGHLLSLCR